MSSHLIDFLEKAVIHVRELKGKGYDYQHPLFKNYLSARQDTVAYMAECLEKVVSQERRLGIFNLFWLVVTKQLVNLQDEVLVKSSASANLRFLIHPHLKSLLNQVLEQVYEKLNITDGVTRKKIPFYRGALKSKLGANFNFYFVTDILNVQLSLIETTIPPLDPLFLIKKILVDENAEYYLNFRDFHAFYSSIRTWVESRLEAGDEWIIYSICEILGVEAEMLPRLNIHNVIFDPRIIFTLQETFKQIPVGGKTRLGLPGRRKNLVDEVGVKVWNQVLLDFVKLTRELQKAEIISYYRDRVSLKARDFWQKDVSETDLSGIEDHVVYNFNSDQIINDMRNVTSIFIDLRGFTEVSSGSIPGQDLKKALYCFFDPALDIIDHYQGKIRFFAGDAVLATFSEDCEASQQTINAVRVGIRIQRMLREFVSRGDLPFEGLGVGIHVGLLESAYIFKNKFEKFDTVIGHSANVTSRLSSGKSVVSERRDDPTFRRDLNDMLQDILEKIKGRVTPNLRNEIVKIFENRMTKDTGEKPESEIYMKLPDMKNQPGNFQVNISGGLLHNNGVALSETAFKDLQKNYDLRLRPWNETHEYVYKDEDLEEEIVFRPVGDASLKGIDKMIPVWSARPEKGQ